DSFLHKISKTDPFYDKERILELKGPFLYESFSWILDHEDFQKWRHTKKSGVLWIKGDPGKGKTMLLCGIINELEKNSGVNINLGYFFCQATDSRINTAASVVAGLIFSLIKRHPALLSPICKKHEDNLSQLNGPNAWAVLCNIFKDLTQYSTIQYPVCIVDALDECEHDCKLLLSLIVKTSGRVKWLLSSRNIKDIERGFRSIEPSRRLSLELKENAENVSKSVDTYINKSIQDIEALEDDEELQTRTTETLRKKANGTFLWVTLVIEQLRNTDHRHVEEVVDQMPEGLENLYDLMIQRANSKLRQKDREACRILLSIVTTAERPLHLKELHVFICSQWEHYKVDYNMRDMKDMVKDLGSLLSIRDETVYFIHQSVKDYMVGNAAKTIFPKGIEYQHYKMAETSLDAMSCILRHNIYDLNDPQIRASAITPPSPDPLMPIAYCCVFWVEHLYRGCESRGFKTDKVFEDEEILHSFLKTNYLAWLESLALLRNLTEQGADAIQKLKNLATRKRGTNCLRTFISDAYHFFHSYKSVVRDSPLQLYHSAIVFEDRHSAIYKAFHQTVYVGFGRLPTVVKRPRRQFSLFHEIALGSYYGVIQVLYSPTTSAVCVLCTDGTISIYRTDTVKRVIELSVDKTCHHYVSFLPDFKHLVSVSYTGVVQTWSIDSGALVQQPERYTTRSVMISPGSTYVATGNPEGSINIWDGTSGECVQVLKRDDSNAPSPVFSPNSELIACKEGEQNDVRIWHLNTGKLIRLLEGQSKYSIYEMAFSDDSKYLVIGYSSAVVKVWCVESGKC
ncbi:uncharacterized protein TRIVIDRAFT_132488, partial [Trichoderma virens Gv29-8]